MAGFINPKDVKEMTVAACLRLDAGGPGFALPLFAYSPSIDNWLVQEIDELTGHVCSFRRMEIEPSLTVSAPPGSNVQVGEFPLYAFVTDSNVLHIGKLKDLEPVLGAYASQSTTNSSIVLQIHELIGSPEEKRQSRIRMCSAILAETGAVSARLFLEGSVLRSVLWNRLIEDSPNEEASRRILAARSLIRAKILPAGKIKIDVSVLSPADYSASLPAELSEELELEFGDLLRSFSVPDSSVANDQTLDKSDDIELTSEQKEAAFNALREISNTKRQEERISILLDKIIEDRSIGNYLLKHYTADRAKYATQVLSSLRATLRDEPKNAKTRIEILIHLVQRPYNRGMPGNRAALLYFMAKHLSKYPEARKVLRHKLDSSSSIFLSRTEIGGLLDSAESGEGPTAPSS